MSTFIINAFLVQHSWLTLCVCTCVFVCVCIRIHSVMHTYECSVSYILCSVHALHILPVTLATHNPLPTIGKIISLLHYCCLGNRFYKSMSLSEGWVILILHAESLWLYWCQELIKVRLCNFHVVSIYPHLDRMKQAYAYISRYVILGASEH